jgi:fimbrial isopeptide formation D2 family protein
MRTECLKGILLSISLLISLLTPILVSVGIAPINMVKAQTANHVVISEFSTRGPAGAYDEFVELYNPTDTDINIQGWKLEYWSGSAWYNRATIGVGDTNVIPSHGFYLLASDGGANPGYSGTTTPDKWWDGTYGIADEDRAIRILDASDQVVDLVGYGSGATRYEGSPGPTRGTANDEKSVERRPGYLDPYAGNGQDTDNNAADFIVRTVREPQNTSSPTEPQAYAVEVSISPEGRIGSPGDMLTYTIIVKNLGSENDNYDLTVADNAGWGLTLDDNRFENVSSGENRTTTLRVAIPENVEDYTIDTITVTATSPNANNVAQAFAATPGVWITKSRSPSIGDYAVAVVGAGENVYIANSDTAGNNYFMCYNTGTDEWKSLSSPPHWFKNGTALAWDNGNYIYALLGASYSDIDAGGRFYFYRYNITSDSWTQLENTPHTCGPGDALSFVPGWVLGVSDDNFLYAILGSNKPSGSRFHRYSIATGSWSAALNFPWNRTDDGSSLVWAGGEYLYALRGEWEETVPHQDFARFKLTDNTWTDLTPIPDEHGVGDGGSLLWVSEYSDYIYALGGGAALETPSYDFYRYRISTDGWAELNYLPDNIGDQNGARLGFASNSGSIYCWRGSFGDPVLWAYNPAEGLVRLQPTDDSYIRDDYPDNNYGDANNMYIGRYSAVWENAFLKFDLSGIPSGVTITEAKLHLYCYDTYPTPTDFWAICNAVDNDAWSEDTVTWNNAPAYGVQLDSVHCAGEGLWYSWTVTSFVADEFGGDKTVSLCVRPADNTPQSRSISVDAKEWWVPKMDPYLKVIYTFAYGVSVSISPNYQSGSPGATLTYTVTVTNIGTENDNYDLVVSDDLGWGLTLSDNVLEVPAGGNRTTTLSVTIPENAENCTEDNIIVVATSQSDNTISDDGICVAHALSAGVKVVISPDHQDAPPKATLEYAVIVVNLGATADNYGIAVSDNAVPSWAPILSENLLENVQPSENRMITLSVTIPENAVISTRDLITVIATSQSDNAVSDNDSCVAHVISPKAEFSLVTLYKVSLDVNLWLENGSELVVKFCGYDNLTLEGENVFWSDNTPAHVVKFENVPHPLGESVKIAKLVRRPPEYFITSFTVTRTHLWDRIVDILGQWPDATPAERNALWDEIIDILGQWPDAPP